MRVRAAEALQKRRRTIRDRYARERREHRGQLALDLEPERRLSIAALRCTVRPDPTRPGRAAGLQQLALPVKAERKRRLGIDSLAALHRDATGSVTPQRVTPGVSPRGRVLRREKSERVPRGPASG